MEPPAAHGDGSKIESFPPAVQLFPIPTLPALLDSFSTELHAPPARRSSESVEDVSMRQFHNALLVLPRNSPAAPGESFGVCHS